MGTSICVKKPNNGSDTFIFSDDKVINLVASGGKWKYLDDYEKIFHIPIIKNNTVKLPSINFKIFYNLYGNLDFQIMRNSIPYVQFGVGGSTCYGQNLIYFGSDGGNTSFGGIGGRGFIAVNKK